MNMQGLHSEYVFSQVQHKYADLLAGKVKLGVKVASLVLELLDLRVDPLDLILTYVQLHKQQAC